MTMNTKPNKDTQTTSDTNLMNGLVKHQSVVASLMIAGVPVPTTDLITTLQSRIAARLKTAAAHKAWLDAVAAEQATVAGSKATVSHAKQELKVMFAGQNETLGDFGLSGPKARTPLTAAEKSAAAEKGKATKAARHPKVPASPAEPATPPASPTPSKS